MHDVWYLQYSVIEYAVYFRDQRVVRNTIIAEGSA